MSRHRPIARAFCVAVGASDAGTGALLVGVPGFVLAVPGIPLPVETVYLRLVGVFVSAVGLTYLYPLLLSDRAAGRARLIAALEWTAGVRLAVALFVAVAVAVGALARAWLLVGFFDAVVGLLQVGLLVRGWGADAI